VEHCSAAFFFPDGTQLSNHYLNTSSITQTLSMLFRCLFFALITAIVFFSCHNTDQPGTAAYLREATSGVSDKALVAAGKDSLNWITYGRTYSEDRYSPLVQINKNNVGKLGLAWDVDLSFKRGFEATPIVVDGIMYVLVPVLLLRPSAIW
jgi:quinohemoprotein ethanol dehydrogenase